MGVSCSCSAETISLSVFGCYSRRCRRIEHVGISSDFDGGGGIEGWSDASETFNVTLELVKRGYTEAEIDLLWSGNLLRVLDEVEETANNLQNNDKKT